MTTIQKFKLYSTKSVITPTLTYTEGVLTGIEYNDFNTGANELTKAHFAWVIESLFVVSEAFVVANKYGYDLQEVATQGVETPTFDVFWEMYAHKNGKKEAKDKWDKLRDADKLLAYQYIGRYFAECRQTGAFKMYAKTYLHRQVWKV